MRLTALLFDPPNAPYHVIVDKVEWAGTMIEQVAMSTIITSAAKSSMCEYFEGINWPLNKALPRGAEFMSGLLGNIVRQYCLRKTQVVHQLLNYKIK